jgi:putative copper export protein
MWVLHLLGGAVWVGGLIGMALLCIPGAVPAADRAAFWASTIRRFSASAMACVAAITLSGLYLYWQHVDGPSQLPTTMYGRVLGVKILLFGTMLLLGAFNQHWLHPRISALREAGDDRPPPTLLLRRFPAAVGVETLLGIAVLFIAPFLHGSARNQAYQADLAAHAATASQHLPKLAGKTAHASTWIWGTAETFLVIAVLLAAYRVSERLIAVRRKA